MKKVFKASLVAATVAFAFSANAANIAVNPVATITEEAVQAGHTVAAASAIVTFWNQETLSAGDKVTLEFPRGTTMPALAKIIVEKGAAIVTFKAVTITPQPATGTVGPKINLEIDTGNPLLANSKIDIYLDYDSITTPFATPTYAPAAGLIKYSATDGFSGAAKDLTGTNTTATTKTVKQETVAVNTNFNAYIERLKRDTFVSKGAHAATITIARPTAGVASATNAVAPAATDVLVVKSDYTDITAGNAKLAYCAAGELPNVVLTAGVPDVATACAGATAATVVDGVLSASAAPAVGAVTDTATFAVPAAAFVANTATGATGTIAKFATYVLPTAGKALKVVPKVEVTRTVTYTQSGVVTAPQKVTYLNAADFGKFQLDATVVNVPYLPVGYAHLSPVVEVSNLGATDATITVEAVGKNGKVYAPVTLTKVAGKQAVTSVFEADLAGAFNLPKGSNEKLNVTFVIDADPANVSLAPYYTNSTLGTTINVVNDQYKK
jgi:hypothetical protein